jgi:hypothetical protein
VNYFGKSTFLCGNVFALHKEQNKEGVFMKNIKTIMGSFAAAKLQAKRLCLLAIALIAVIVFSFATCSNGSTGGGGKPSGTTPTPGITPTPTPTSGNTVTWTQVTNSTFGTFESINGIAYGSNKFVAVGGDGNMAYSTDGITWIAVASLPFGSRPITAIVYVNNKFVAWGDSKTATSLNGETWTPVSSSHDIGEVAYGNGTFVSGKAYSTDGVTWTPVTNSTFGYTGDSIEAVAFGNGKFFAVGGDANNNYKMSVSTDDGKTWTGVTTTAFSKDLFAITFADGKFVAGGDDRGNKMATSTDGTTWITVDGKLGRITAIAYGNNKFVAGDWAGGMAYSPDGTTWTATATNLPSSNNIKAIAYGSGKFVAGTDYGKIVYSTGL